MLETVPDEFLAEVRGWITEIETIIVRIKAQAQQVFDEALKSSRKEFAIWVNTHHRSLAQYLLAMMDNIEPLIFQYHEWGHTKDEA